MSEVHGCTSPLSFPTDLANTLNSIFILTSSKTEARDFPATGPQEPAGPPQWESTSIADLDPFGGVPNRGAVNGVSHAVNLPVRNLEPRPHGGYNRPYPSGGRGRDMRASYDAVP